MSLQKLTHTYQLKRGKEDTLLEQNPLLERGEPIVIYFNDGTTGLKIGDGINAYNDLPLISGSNNDIDFSKLLLEIEELIRNSRNVQQLTFDEYTQLTTVDDKVMYVCTDTQQIFAGKDELTKSTYILEEIPTAETVGNNGSIYYCKKDLSLYLCNKVEDSYIWTIVASMDANGFKITETGKDDVAISINLDSIDDYVKLRNINIKNGIIQDTNIDKLGHIYTTNKNLYGGDFTALPILSELVPGFILDRMHFSNNELIINHEQVIDYLENNPNVEQEIIYDEELGMHKYLIASVKMPENPTDDELIVADMDMFITEDCRLKLEGFMLSEEPEDLESLLDSDFTIPVYVFGTPPVEAGMPLTDNDNDTFRLYFTSMNTMIPVINFGLDFTFNGENINDCTSYYQMKKLFNIDNSSDDKVIDIRLNDSSYLLTFDMVKQETIKLKSEYEKLVEAGINDIDESLKNNYKITYGDFKANYYMIALLVKGDLIYGNKPEDELEEFERTSNVVLNGSKLFLEKLPYETVTEILKINGTELSDAEKSAIIIDKTGRVTAAEGFQVPSEYLSGFELTYKYKKNYTNSFATHNYAIQIDDDEFITECNKLYASQVYKQLLPEALTEDNQFIEDMLVNDEITLQASGEGNNYILLSNIESEYEAKVSLSNKLNNNSSGSTSKVSVKEELDNIIKLTGTVDMTTVFKPGYYLVEADKILNGPTMDAFDDNTTTINNKEIVISAGGNEVIFDTPCSIFMEVTEYPFNNIGYMTTFNNNGEIIESINYIHSIRLKLPLHTYILNRIIYKPVDDYNTRIINDDYSSDELNSGTNNQLNGWYVDDVVSGAPNILLKPNNYISLDDPINLDSDIINDLSLYLPHNNTKILNTTKLEALLDNLQESTNTFVNVPTDSIYNYIYVPQYNGHNVLFKRRLLSSTPSNGHESCKLDLNSFVTAYDNINKYYYVDSLTAALYETTTFNSFKKIIDFNNLRFDDKLFRSYLAKDSDLVLGAISYSLYKEAMLQNIKKLLYDKSFYITCPDQYSNPIIYLYNGNNMQFIIDSAGNVYPIMSDTDELYSYYKDIGFIRRYTGYYDNGRYKQITIPILTYYNNDNELVCYDLYNDRRTVIFKLDTDKATHRITKFLHKKDNADELHYKFIDLSCSDKNLSSTDFTETIFDINTVKIVNDLLKADEYTSPPYLHLDAPYTAENYNESYISKTVQSISDYIDLLDEEKQTLIEVLTYGINRLNLYGGKLQYTYIPSSIDNQTTKTIYNGLAEICVAENNVSEHSYIYIIDNIVIVKNSDGTYNTAIRTDNVIQWVNITEGYDNNNIYFGSGNTQYIHLYYDRYPTKQIIDNSNKSIKYNIYESYLLGNLETPNIRYVPYRVDYVNNGKLLNFKGTLSNSTYMYNWGTYIKSDNIINKFNISAPGYFDKDNKLVKYEEAPEHKTYDKPLYCVPLEVDVRYGDSDIRNVINIKNEELFLGRNSYIDLIEGKLYNAKTRITLLEGLGISKEKYIELINSITSITEVHKSAYINDFGGNCSYDFIEVNIADSGVSYRDYDFYGSSHNIRLEKSNTIYVYGNPKDEEFLDTLFIGGGGSYALHLWINKDRFDIKDTSTESLEKFKQIFLSLVENKEAEFYENCNEPIQLQSIPNNLSHTSAILKNNDTNYSVKFDIDLLCDVNETDYITNITLNAKNWNKNEEFIDMGYNYEYQLFLSGFDSYFKQVSEIQYQDVKDNIMDNLSKFAINNEESNNYVKIYAKEKPEKDINIRYIKITY